MKVRNGFVSNSSSSSFVVILPENFLETIDYDKIVEENGEDFPLKKFKKLLNQFIKDEYLYDEEFYNIDSDYDLRDIFNELLRPYIIAEMETSSDAGQVVIGDRKKVQEILDKTK